MVYTALELCGENDPNQTRLLVKNLIISSRGPARCSRSSLSLTLLLPKINIKVFCEQQLQFNTDQALAQRSKFKYVQLVC